MKGVVFNLLEEVVRRHHGEDLWDDLLDHSDLDGAYTSLGSYSDGDIEALVASAATKLDLSRGDVLRWFGQTAMPVLAELYPAFFEPHRSSRSFVLGVNSIIHAEVRKLYTGADCPHFNFRDGADGALLMDYRSSRRMCALAQGFIEGAANQYGETLEFRHDSCVEHGASYCVFHIQWPSLAA